MNRSAFAFSLLAATAVGTAAFAQDAAPPAPPAPAAAAPAAPAAPPAAPPIAPEAPPPVLPTSGDGAAIVNVLTKVCTPLTKGAGKFEDLMKANGFKLNNKTSEYELPLSQKPYMLHMLPPSANNKTICSVNIRYAPGGDPAIIDAMNVWRFLHKPQLHLERSDKMTYPTVERVTTTWDNYENQLIDGQMIGLVLVQLNKPDGTAALTPTYDDAVIQYAERAAQAGDGVVDPKALAEQQAKDAAAAKAAADAAAAAAAAPPAAPAAPPATPPAN